LLIFFFNIQIYNNKVHLARVMGVVLDNLTNYLYSISEDKHFKIQDISKNDLIYDIVLGNSGLTCLAFDKEYKRIFIGNRSGNVFLYDVSSVWKKVCFNYFKFLVLSTNSAYPDHCRQRDHQEPWIRFIQELYFHRGVRWRGDLHI